MSAHGEALDQVRAELCAELRRDWPLRCKKHARERCVRSHGRCAWCRAIRVRLAQLRALDAVREQARDRDLMADVWMYIACGLSREEAFGKARAERAGR